MIWAWVTGIKPSLKELNTPNTDVGLSYTGMFTPDHEDCLLLSFSVYLLVLKRATPMEIFHILTLNANLVLTTHMKMRDHK